MSTSEANSIDARPDLPAVAVPFVPSALDRLRNARLRIGESQSRCLSEWQAARTALEVRERELAACERSLAAQREEIGRAQSELEKRREAWEKHRDSATREQVDAFRELRRDLRRMAKLRKEVGEREAALAAQPAETSPADAERAAELNRANARLLEENAALQRDLSAAERQADEADLLRRRCEELERDLSGMEALLAQRPAAVASGSAASERPSLVPGLDWESQKQLLLAQLESEYDERDPRQSETKRSLEQTIRATGRLVEERDHEITELRKLLETQSANLGSVAVGAAAVAQMLDNDDLIREERENLRRMQDEWTEKLRKAEVDISMERAKLARERAQLEEKLQAIESERSRSPSPSGDNGPRSADKTPRSRWLARLGLSQEES